MVTKDKTNDNGTVVEQKKRVRKQGYKHIGGDVPEDLYIKLTEFNKTAVRPINISRVIENAIRAELDKA